MMMSDLPADLVEEILYRVPATSLKQLRSTCKRWNSLLKKYQRFTEKHFREAAKQPLVLMLKDYRVFPVSIDLNAAPSMEFKGALSLQNSHFNSEQVDIVTAFHCDGLLLCTTIEDRLVVWNPYLGETKWIQLKTDYMRNSNFALGYQNNKSCCSYKILRCWDVYEPINHVVGSEIYEFTSDSWRVLGNVALNCFIESNTGVSLKGNTYWFASEEYTNFLLSFDFTRERFNRLCLPPIPNSGTKVLSVVREEELSLLHQNILTSKMEIWMTKRVDSEAALLWRKSFTIDLKSCGPYSFPICMSFVIDEEKNMTVYYTAGVYVSRNMVKFIRVDDQYYTEIPFEVSTNWKHTIIFNYVPSLVQI